MAINKFIEFDQIISERHQFIKKHKKSYDELRKACEAKRSNIYYGKSNTYLGHFCPSMIFDSIVGNFKRDKLKATIPKKLNYVTYEVDIEGKLLRTCELVSNQVSFETYIIRQKNEEYSLTFLEGKLVPSAEIVRTIYDNERVARLDIIGNSSIWSEIYEYNKDNEILCRHYYYIPELMNSDKSIDAGNPNSPMVQHDYKITIDNLGMRHVELI